MPTKTRSYVEAKETFSGRNEDAPFVVRRGEVFASDHPIVRSYRRFFRPLERQRPEVEQMTQEPGEKRGD